jgi:hypothetical protein
MKKLHYSIAIIFSLLLWGQLEAQNIMKLGNVSVQAGQESTLTVSIDNSVSFVAFQFDIPIPSGMTYVESSAVLDATRKVDHNLSVSIISPNTLRLIGYSINSTAFNGASGAVVTFKIKAGSSPGDFVLTLTNPIIGDANSTNILTSSVNGTVKILSPRIQLSVASLDFGRVALQQTQDRNVTITNSGNQTLNVTGITFTNPQFTVIGGSSFTLDANGTKNITVRFSSQTKGTYNEKMSISSNDPALSISTDTLKSVAFAVNEIHTGNLIALSGQTKTLDFTINNMEDFTAFQFDIPLPSTMQYVSGSAVLLRKTDHAVSCNLLTGNILRVVAYSSSNTPFTGTDGKVLSLDFKIVGQAGWYPINVNNGIISDAAGSNAMSASYNGQLQVSAPQISTVQSLAYGDVSILSSKTLNLKVYNYGGDVLNIDQLTFSDSAFSSTQTLPLSIPIGQNKDIPVAFSKSSKGTVSATLKINSNDPVTNPFTVNLSANAYAPNYINVKDFNGVVGSKVIVAIDVDNEEDFVALQCDLKYPSYLVPDSTGIVLTDRKVDHSVQSNRLGNNTIRLVAFSLSQQAFKGKSGAVINIPFTISAGAVAGSYPLEISNGILGNAASQNIQYGTRNGTFTINSIVGSPGVITGNASVCKGGTETYTVGAITGATSYIWTLPTGFTGTSTTNSITVTIGTSAVSGSIKVKGHNSSGDGTESSFAITVNDVPSAAGTVSGNVSVCKSGSETYSVQAITGATSYIWTLPTGLTGTSTTNSINITIGSSAVAGNIKVKGHNSCGDGTESALAITVNDVPSAAGTISGNTIVYKGTSETYTVPAIAGATSYFWTLPTGVTGTSTTNSITVTIESTAVSGNIKVKGHNSCGDGVEKSLAITINDVTAGVITGNISVCKGGTETYTVGTIAGATSYIWTLPTGATGTSSTNTISVTFSSTAVSGSIKVKGHNSGGDGTESSLAITVNDIPSDAGVITGNITVCKGGTETFTVLSITGATSYIWTLPTGFSGTSTTNSITITIGSTAVAGSIKVKGHNSCGDGGESTLAITVNDVPSAAGIITGNAVTYKGMTETYTVPAIVGATSYIWTLPTGVTGTSSTNSISVTISSTAISGNIKVKGNNSCGDGTESSLAVTINEVSSGVVTGNTSVCRGGSETYTVGTIAGATSYIWTLPTGATGTSSTNSISVTFGANAVSGSIKVKGHNSGGDGTESLLAIIVNDVPSSAGTISGNTTTLKGTTETYTIPTINGATSYIWTLPTGITGSSTINSIIATISSSAVNGSIKVKGHNSCGDGTESSLAITVNDAGKNNMTVKGTTACSGTDVMVTIDVDNGLPFIALQCDIKYPSYLTPKTSGIVLTDRAGDHNIQTSLPAANTLRVLAYSLTLQSFKGNTGAVVQIPFTINSTAVAGSYPLELSNVTLGNSQSQNILDNSYNGTMVINSLPSDAGIITGNTNICSQTTNIVYTVPAISGATSYNWTLPTGVTGTSTTNTISLNYGSGSASGNLKVKGHNDCGDGSEASLAITVCLGVGIEDNFITNKIEVFPNPTKDIFYVTINKPFNNDFKVEISNSFGQVLQTIFKQQRDNKFSVDLTNFSKGIYVIRFSDKEAYFNCKIVKQ